MTSLKGLAAATSILALTLTLGACSGGGSDKSTLQQAIDDGKITVGFAGEAPYSFEEGGELQGASVALAKQVFKNLGVDNVDGVNTEFGSLIPGLNAERFDAISAGMSILPDRCKQASFGNPEFMYTTALMTKKGENEGLKNLDEVKEKGLKLATMTGAVESDYAKALGIESQQVGTPQDGMDAVTTGRADAFALTGISLNWMAKNTPNADVAVSESFVQEIDGVPQVVRAHGLPHRRHRTARRVEQGARQDRRGREGLPRHRRRLRLHEGGAPRRLDHDRSAVQGRTADR